MGPARHWKQNKPTRALHQHLQLLVLVPADPCKSVLLLFFGKQPPKKSGRAYWKRKKYNCWDNRVCEIISVNRQLVSSFCAYRDELHSLKQDNKGLAAENTAPIY